MTTHDGFPPRKPNPNPLPWIDQPWDEPELIHRGPRIRNILNGTNPMPDDLNSLIILETTLTPFTHHGQPVHQIIAAPGATADINDPKTNAALLNLDPHNHKGNLRASLLEWLRHAHITLIIEEQTQTHIILAAYYTPERHFDLRTTPLTNP